MKLSIKDFFCRFDEIRRIPQIWSHLLKNSLMENFIFCVVLSSLLASSISNISATISVSEGRGCTAKTSASTSVTKASSIFSETRSGWMERRFSVSFSSSLKGFSSSAMAAFCRSIDILDFQKQFTTAFAVTTSQAATNICIHSSEKILGEIFSSNTWDNRTHNILMVLCFQWANHTLVHWLSLRSCVQWEEK